MKKVDGWVKLILMGGFYIDIQKCWQWFVFFDQVGVFVCKFGIKQVFVVVMQEGKCLCIDELVV